MTLSAMQAVSYAQFPVSELNTSISAIRFAYSTSRTICCFAKNLFEQSRKLWLFNRVSLWQRYYIAVFCIRYLEGNFITFISYRITFDRLCKHPKCFYPLFPIFIWCSNGYCDKAFRCALNASEFVFSQVSTIIPCTPTTISNVRINLLRVRREI